MAGFKGFKVTEKMAQQLKEQGFLRDEGTEIFTGRVKVVEGKITTKQMLALTEAVDKYGSNSVVICDEEHLDVPGIHFGNIAPFREKLEQAGLETGGTGVKIHTVVTCPHCERETVDIAADIQDRFYKGYEEVDWPHEFEIAICVCENRGAKFAFHDIDIFFENSKSKSGKKVVTSGGNSRENRDLGLRISLGGTKIASGKALEEVFYTTEEALDMVEQAMLLYRAFAYKGETITEMVKRVGFQRCQDLLTNGTFVDEKERLIKKAISDRPIT